MASAVSGDLELCCLQDGDYRPATGETLCDACCVIKYGSFVPQQCPITHCTAIGKVRGANADGEAVILCDAHAFGAPVSGTTDDNDAGELLSFVPSIVAKYPKLTSKTVNHGVRYDNDEGFALVRKDHVIVECFQEAHRLRNLPPITDNDLADGLPAFLMKKDDVESVMTALVNELRRREKPYLKDNNND